MEFLFHIDVAASLPTALVIGGFILIARGWFPKPPNSGGGSAALDPPIERPALEPPGRRRRVDSATPAIRPPHEATRAGSPRER